MLKLYIYVVETVNSSYTDQKQIFSSLSNALRTQISQGLKKGNELGQISSDTSIQHVSSSCHPSRLFPALSVIQISQELDFWIVY